MMTSSLFFSGACDLCKLILLEEDVRNAVCVDARLKVSLKYCQLVDTDFCSGGGGGSLEQSNSI